MSCKKQRLHNKPWITKGILISIQNKQKLHKSHFLKGNDVSKLIYKTYANKHTKVKSLAKKLFFAQELTNCKGGGRKMWEVIETLIPLNSTKKSKVTPGELEINGSLIQDPKLIADKFGKHLSNIAASITDGISPSTHLSDFKRFLPNRVTDSIFMQPTDPAEVFSTIMTLTLVKVVALTTFRLK